MNRTPHSIARRTASRKSGVARSSRLVMTADEVAELLRVDRKTVYAAAGRGEIPCRRIGRRLLFSRTAIVAWLEMQGHAARGEQ